MLPDRTESENVKIIGFDLGHAETALILLTRDRGDIPGRLAISSSNGGRLVTAVAVVQGDDEEILIGREAIYDTPDDGKGVISYLAFKDADLSRDEVRRPIELFVGEVVRQIHASGTVHLDGPEADRLTWMFGAPSGWNAEERQAYEELLAALCDAPVTVIPESRAALLWAREGGVLPTSFITEQARRTDGKSVLIIDMGSSTTDFTSVSGLREQPLDHLQGRTLGASLIDREIVRRMIRSQPTAVQAKFQRLMDEPEFAVMRNRLELRGREAKEKFFQQKPKLVTRDPTRRYHLEVQVVTGPGGEVLKLEFTLSADDMDEVLNTPLPELDGLSWREAFRQELVHARAMMDEAPNLIVLTGGASAMWFVQPLCEEIFPEARIARGTEPGLAIATGLAYAGRVSHRVGLFRKDIGAFLASDEIKEIVDAALPELASAIGKAYAAGMTEKHLIPAFRRWREGRITTLRDIANEVMRTSQPNLDPARNPQLRKVLIQWQNKITDEVTSKIQIYRAKYDIPEGAMVLPRADASRMDVTFFVGLGTALLTADVLATVLTAVIGVVAAVAAFYLTALGPFGLTVLGLTAAAGTAIGWGVVREKLFDVDLPTFVRKSRTEKGLVKSLTNKAGQFEEQVARDVAASFLKKSGEKITRDITAAVGRQVQETADAAELLIR